MARFLGVLARSMRVTRRVRLEFIGSLALALCFAACAGGGSTSTSQATGTAQSLPTATSQPSSSTSTPQPSSSTSTPQPSPATATATAQSSLACSDLTTFYQAISGKQGQVMVTMSISTTTVIHGSLKQYTSQPESTMSGPGYIVSPNDQVQLKVIQGPGTVTVSVTDTVSGTHTIYTVSQCSPSTSDDLKLTGTSPVNFTMDIVLS